MLFTFKKLNIEFEIFGWTSPLQRVYYTHKSMQKNYVSAKAAEWRGF